MLGWLADIFRLYGGLLYWNLRKSWFRVRRGQSESPCQSLSDSGRAFETNCEACVHWNRPIRFRRVCPLIVETPDGLRCSVDTVDVRPFWGRVAGYYGGLVLAIYLAAVLTVFAFLRSVGYPVSVFDVGLPPLWHRLTHARAWYFFEQSKSAFAAGRAPEGMLYLANAYEFNPSNYQIGITLAKNYQVSQPARSDDIFQRLMKDHPDLRNATAQDWFRALLPRGNFAKIAQLAQEAVLSDPAHAHAWMRALLFATRQLGDPKPLQDLLADRSPRAAVWHQLLNTELLIRSGNQREARAALAAAWPEQASPYTLVYRISNWIVLGDPTAALDLVERSRRTIGDEAWVTLRLEGLAAAGNRLELRTMVDLLLSQPPNLAITKILCAQLIRYPDAELFDRVARRLDRDNLPVNNDTIGIWLSILCTAGVVGDTTRLSQLTDRLKRISNRPFVALNYVEGFFQGKSEARQIVTVLPILPLPTEVTYALLERYSKTPLATENTGRIRLPAGSPKP